MTGETAAARVRRRRLERAAARLLATPLEATLAIALEVGFASAPVFTRSLWQRFAAWCAERGCFDGRHAAIGISQDSPDITAPDQLRYDACIEVDAGFVAQGEIGVQTLHGGRYACTPFRGTGADIHDAWMHFYGEWLPKSGWQADDRPALELYGTALQVDAKSGAFSCELAIPVLAA